MQPIVPIGAACSHCGGSGLDRPACITCNGAGRYRPPYSSTVGPCPDCAATARPSSMASATTDASVNPAGSSA